MAELVDVLVEIRGHAGHLRFGQRVDAERLDQLVHPAGGDAGEVAVGDDGDQRGLGALAALEQPFREVCALPELGDGDVDRADTGVQLAVPVAVALRHPVGAGLAPFGAADGVCVRGQQRVDHRLQQLPHQIRRRLSEGFTEQASRVDNVRSGHRDDSIREGCRRFLEGSHGDRAHVHDEADHRAVTPLCGTPLRISPLRHYTRRMTEHLGCSGGTAHAMRPQVRPKQQQPIADLRSLITDRGEVVDCQCGREHTVDQLGTEFEFPENMREILREGAGRPRLDVFGPSFLLRINRIAKAGQEDLRIESLHIVFHDDWLVVFEDVDGIGTAWHPAEDNSGRYFAADEAELTLTLIVEAAIDSYDSAALSLEDGTADCESSIFGEFEKDIESVYRLGSDASKVRSSLASLCRFIDRIPAPGASKNSDWSADAAAFAEDADDLLSRVSGIHARLTQLVTVYLALVAQKQNEDMKRVSGWAAILFTPSLVGAIYGMNFASIPELTWDFGYPLSILAMVIISAGLYAVFRRQRWL